jgi:signal transduction histidine kinase
MRSEPGLNGGFGDGEKWLVALPWVIGLLVSPILWALFAFLSKPKLATGIAAAIGSLLAPIPGLAILHRRRRGLLLQADQAVEEAARLKAQLETVRYRTARLREDLSAADRQARLSHQLTLLGQFTAGFMHEFNNPLSIVVSRIEVLLEERKDDAPLCTDLQQMLKDAHYMGNIATTLLQALRRERGAETFEPSAPAEAIDEAIAAMTPAANQQGVRLVRECPEAPRVDLPGHVISEVLRGLIGNALQALQGRENPVVWLRLDPYRTPGSKVVLRVEDNGPGVPQSIQPHLFEPFVSRSPGRERLGLGLFLGASLMDMYDGRLNYEARPDGGACFAMEMPPARFAKGRPYHWFAGGDTL